MTDASHPEDIEKDSQPPGPKTEDEKESSDTEAAYVPNGDTFTTELDNLLDMLGKGLDVDAIKEELSTPQPVEVQQPQAFEFTPSGAQIFKPTHTISQPTELLEALAEPISQKCPFDYLLLLGEIAHKTDYLRMDVIIDHQKKVHSANRVYPIKDSILQDITRQQQPVVYQLTDSLRGKFEKEMYDRLGLHTCLLIPVAHTSAGLSLLVIGSKKDNQYTDDDSALGWLVSAMSLALRRLYQAAAIQKQTAVIDLINQISRKTVASEFHFDQLLKLTLARIHVIFEMEAGVVYLKEEDRLNALLTFNTGSEGIKQIRQKIGQRLAGVVVSRGKPMIVNDTQRIVKSVGELAKQKVLNTRAILCVPLAVCDKVVGAMELFSKENVGVAKLDDTLLNMVAAALAPALLRHLSP